MITSYYASIHKFYIEDYLANIQNVDLERVAVGHTGLFCPFPAAGQLIAPSDDKHRPFSPQDEHPIGEGYPIPPKDEN